MKSKWALSFLIALFSMSFVFALNYSSDGSHDVNKGDYITLNNGWKVEIVLIGFSSTGETIQLRVYDPRGNSYPTSPYIASFQKAEGKKKFGSDTKLGVELEIISVSGTTLNQAGVSWTEKSDASINFVSINEDLPGSVSGGNSTSPISQDTNKVLTYKNGRKVTLGLGEEFLMGNNYKLKLESFDQRWFNPIFSLFDDNGAKVDNYITLGKDTDSSLGSYVYVNDYDQNSVDLTVIDGTKVTFGTDWNLFSIYLDDGDGFGTILESTCNEATIWGWDSKNRDYEKIGLLKEGTKIPSNRGLWVRVQSKKDTSSDMDCVLIVSGKNSVSTNSIKLNKGWNAIGSPISAYGRVEEYEGGTNFNFLTFNDIKGDCVIEKGPWQFLATKYTHTSIISDIFDERKFSKPFEDTLRLNRGYFIKVANDCTLGDIK